MGAERLAMCECPGTGRRANNIAGQQHSAVRCVAQQVNRLKPVGFRVTKTLGSFDVADSSIQPKVFDYLSSL